MADSDLGLNSRGDDVRALQEDLRRFGLPVPKLEMSDAVFGAGTQAAVRQLQTSTGQQQSGVFDSATREALDKAQLVTQYATPRVEGQLVTEHGALAAGTTVRLYRRPPGGTPVPVGETTTDSVGFYRLDYDAAPQPGAAIEVRVVTPDGAEMPITVPKPSAARHEVLDLVVPTSVVPLASEIDRLAADVEQALGGFEPLVRAVNGSAANDDLVPDGDDRLADAHRATGWDARLLALAAASDDLARTAAGLATDMIGTALETALLYLSHTAELAERLSIDGWDRVDLVTLWGPMPTRGAHSTYARLFLSPRTGTPDPVFDHPSGDYLTDSAVTVDSHRSAVQAALGMSADEVDAVLAAAQLTAATPLTIGIVSMLHGYALLARALGLPVLDLLKLRALTGVDPLGTLPATRLPGGPGGAAADLPLSRTIAFMDIAEDLQRAGLSVAELDYLLAHRFDAVGPLREDANAVLQLVVEVTDGLGQIAADHAPPDVGESGVLADTAVAREVGSVLRPDAVATFMAMWQRQAVYTSTKPVALAADVIVASTLAAFPEVTVDDRPDPLVPGGRRQQLSYRGVPVTARLAAIKAANSSSVLDQLLADVTAHADRDRSPFGWLVLAADVEPLFAPPPIATGDADADAAAAQAFEGARRSYFAVQLLPRVLATLRRRFIVATVGGALAAQASGVAPSLIEALLTNPGLVTATGGATPLADTIATVAAAGLSLTATDSTGAALPADPVVLDATTAGVAGLAGAARAVFDGYLEVPVAGLYRFAVSLTGTGDTAELWVGDGADPVLRAVGPTTNPAAEGIIDLRAGVLYRLTLAVTGPAHAAIAGSVAVTVRADTLPAGPISRLTLRSAAAVASFARVHLLLRKALLLVGRLGLSERELRHICGHPADFGLSLSQLPTSVVDPPTPASFAAVRRLLTYVRLRAEMAGGRSGLVGVFELAHRTLPRAAGTGPEAVDVALKDLCKEVAALTRRDPKTVRAAALHLFPLPTAVAAGTDWQVDAVAFADERGLRRLWDALAVVAKLGIGIEAVIAAATPEPNLAVAHGLRDAVRARYELDNWRSVARAVNDPLRQRRRDALVAYLLNKLHLDRVEELFEFLLLDPGTEPVVLTSRLRLAISSVQLFVQRCLLNLEQDVPPVSISADRWAWMKRYRAWEANRKIFLFPENWLDPELRDNQTGLFTALMGALMQSEVTNQLAEDALVTYLRGLAEIARLEIVSVWAQADPHGSTGNTLHVLGRDHNAPRNHHYRRFAGGEWTPWERVTTQIEGDHAAIVMYRGRIHILWVTFMEQSVRADTGQQNVEQLVKSKPGSLQSVKVQAQLSWTELVSGQWTPRASSSYVDVVPATPDTFYPEQVDAYISKEVDANGELSITLNLVSDQIAKGLRFVSRNGIPLVLDVPRVHPPAAVGGSSSGRLVPVEFSDALRTSPNSVSALGDTVLKQTRPFNLLSAPEPAFVQSPEMSALVNPFFYVDRTDRIIVNRKTERAMFKNFTSEQTFFVMPALEEDTFVAFEGGQVPVGRKSVHTADTIDAVRLGAGMAPPSYLLATGELIHMPLESVSPVAIFALNTPTDWVTAPDTVLTVHGRRVGASGVQSAIEPSPTLSGGSDSRG